MNEKAKTLFEQNYRNEGDCKDLPKYLKSFDKEFKRTNTSKKINYYPWAVVERIFRSQGGKIVVKEWAMKVALEVQDFLPNENGEMILQTQPSNALFIHLSAEWQGETEDEFYPVFDSQSAKIIKAPDALELNTAKQRGMVRLIARISGIGLDAFEQQETQFADDTCETTPIITNKTTEKVVEKKSKKEGDKVVQKLAMTEVVEAQVKPKAEAPVVPDVMAAFLRGEVPSEQPKPESTPITVAKATSESYGNDTQEYADLLLEVRKNIRDQGTQQQAKEYVQSLGKELLSQLTYSELQELNKKSK